MRIKDIPKENRPRERFLKQGPEALSNAELLAIILQKGSKEENVIDMSNRLISKYGMDKLSDLSLTELQEIKGIGPAKAMQILTMSELGKRYNQSKLPQTKRITCSEDVFNIFYERLKDKKQEHFYILMLDIKNKIIGEQLISKGTLDASIIHPREIFSPAIKNVSAKIILVHNHPSGDPSPSEEDLRITNKLRDIGEELGIKVLDSVILGKERFWSEIERKEMLQPF